MTEVAGLLDLDSLPEIVDSVVAPEAAGVDATGEFPRRGIDALANAGLLALTVPVEHGGSGLGIAAAASLVRRLGRACGSTAMVTTMHYAATAVLTAVGAADVLSEIGAGRHLSTLAFSEAGSRSHFWAPLGTAAATGGSVTLDAHKSWVTSAHEADSMVWSSRPLSGEAGMTLWNVPGNSDGLSVVGTFDGLGLRGNDSCPITAERVTVPASAMLGADGSGLDIALTVALPTFLILNASSSVGLMEALCAETAAHLTGTQLEHLGQSLAQQLPTRTALARMRIETDRTRALIEDVVSAVETGREDAQLLVLESKAASDPCAASVSDLAMTACGGSAFRKELGIDRRFRDARAGRVMAPTTAALEDFIGRALTGLPLMEG